MSSEHLHHPIQAAIDDIWNAGHTPRLQIDARRDDVVVPDSVRERWGARLVLDLDASWPLNLQMDESGVAVDLAFQGVVTRCTLPWASIYVVLDRSTGRGVVIESHMPRDGAGEASSATAPRAIAPRATPPRAMLREVGPEMVEPPKSAPPKRVPPASAQPASAQPPKSTQPPGEGAADVSSEEEARRRRSRFKVIDGGQ
ncbi:MAG: ClpXP protease specificity-enhancing factor SspB [Myxococcota bacterium]|nr:ClpXP protease specificity-enhancing factor SspB [Myxococcota bacterium]